MLRLPILVAASATVFLAAPVEAETFSRTVPSGRPSAIASFGGYVVGTCANVGLPDARPRLQPRNGTLRIVHERGKPAGGTCKDTDQWFLVFIYTPNKGFKGEDVLSIDIPWQTHEHAPHTLLTYTYRIAVQ